MLKVGIESDSEGSGIDSEKFNPKSGSESAKDGSRSVGNESDRDGIGIAMLNDNPNSGRSRLNEGNRSDGSDSDSDGMRMLNGSAKRQRLMLHHEDVWDWTAGRAERLHRSDPEFDCARCNGRLLRDDLHRLSGERELPVACVQRDSVLVAHLDGH